MAMRTAQLFILMAYGMINHVLDFCMDLFVNLVSTYVNAKVATFFLRGISHNSYLSIFKSYAIIF